MSTTVKPKKTHEEVFDFIKVAQRYLAEHKEQTKLRHALLRELKWALKVHKRYQRRVEDIQIEYCWTDERGVITTDARGELEFTREKIVERNKALRDLYDSAIEVETYFATEVPDTLTEEERDAFEGFVLRAEEEPAAAKETEAE